MAVTLPCPEWNSAVDKYIILGTLSPAQEEVEGERAPGLVCKLGLAVIAGRCILSAPGVESAALSIRASIRLRSAFRSAASLHAANAASASNVPALP